MRIRDMSEPVSSGLAGVGLVKIAGFLFGATFASIVVMAMTQPKSTREWVVALICTVIASICGGAFVVQWFELHRWAEVWEGSVALAGLHFVCGLPAWVFVRAWFVYAEKRQTMSLTDMIRELREALRG
ncbi:DUF1275 family protein [Halopseudomonas salina]|nr:DUF1275 family protein [Halopseudomonas salina]